MNDENDDLDNLQTPDAYVKNHGVVVELEMINPQYGRINVRFMHNDYQSTRLQMGLAQAEELYEKLGEMILVAGFDMNAAWKFVAESYGDWSPNRKDWTNEDIIEFIREHHVTGPEAFRLGAGEEQ